MGDPTPPPWYWWPITLPIMAFLWVCLWCVEGLNWLLRLFTKERRR